MRTAALLGIALALCVPACADRQAGERSTVSAVTNADVERNGSGDEAVLRHRKTYTKVDETAALNHDQAALEHEAMTGHLGRGNAPQGALSEANEPQAVCEQHVYFDSGSAQLSEHARAQLHAIAECMKRRETDHATVVGSADPRGTAAENKLLGERRAEAVESFLIECGVPEQDIRVESVGEEGAASRGATLREQRQAQVQNP